MNKIQIIVMFIVLILLTIAVFLYKKKKKSEIVKPVIVPQKKEYFDFSCQYGDNFPLRLGSCGERVKLLQKYMKIEQNGKFDYKMQDRVIASFAKEEVTREDLIGRSIPQRPLDENIFKI